MIGINAGASADCGPSAAVAIAAATLWFLVTDIIARANRRFLMLCLTALILGGGL